MADPIDRIVENLDALSKEKQEYEDVVIDNFWSKDVSLYRDPDLKQPFPFVTRNTGAILYVSIPDLEIKKDTKTPGGGTIKVVVERRIVFKNFILQQSTEVDQEKVQITETFGGEDIFYAFGRRPRIYSYSGAVIRKIPNYEFDDTAFVNTNSNVRNYGTISPSLLEKEEGKFQTDRNYEEFGGDYIQEFLSFYENFRASKLLEKKSGRRPWKLYLFYETFLIEGFLLSMSIDRQALMKNHCLFNFNMLVRNITDLIMPALPNENTSWINAEIQRIKNELGDKAASDPFSGE